MGNEYSIISALLVAVLIGLSIAYSFARRELNRERKLLEGKNWEISELKSEKTKAETMLVAAKEQEETLKATLETEISLKEIAYNSRIKAETESALREQEIDGIKIRMEDWEKAKKESIEAANAAALSVTRELSSKLLEDHKREASAAKKEAEEREKRLSKELLRQVEQVTESVTSLNSRVDQNTETVDDLWKALSSPSGAGQLTELHLENRLKSHGLKKGIDFNIQFYIEGKNLRPDSVVFLPSNSVLVIDCKASKYLAELAKSEGTEEEETAYSNLSKTMNEHLKSLAGKKYQEQIIESYRAAGRANEINQTFSVMFLPNEGALEKIARADPKFESKARKQSILLAGPAALECLIGFACAQIDLAKQAESHEEIIKRTELLLDTIVAVIGHTGKLGNGLQAAFKNYEELTRSIKGLLSSRARKLGDYGIRPKNPDGLKKNIPLFHFAKSDDADYIDVDVEEIDDVTALTDQSSDID